jgi:putative endonuclease
MYFVYIIQCLDNSLYTGITTDLKRRFEEHKNNKGARYTASRGAKRLIYSEQHPTRSAASKREAEIKSWKREKKLRLAASDNNQ